ncbi:MAG: hypothetical protein RR400_00820 [Clostridia bacterium]
MKCNLFVCFLLMIFGAVCTVTFFPEIFSSEAEGGGSEDVLPDDGGGDVPPTLKKQNFKTSNAAMKFAFDYLNGLDGYASTTKGEVYGGALGITVFKQSMDLGKRVNNGDGSSLVQFETIKRGKFGGDNRYRFFGTNKSTSYTKYLKEYPEGKPTFYINDQYQSETRDKFIEDFGIDTKNAFYEIENKDIVKNVLINNGSGFVVNLELDASDIVQKVIKFSSTLFTIPNGMIKEINVDSFKVKISIDKYGVLKSINTKASFLADVGAFGISAKAKCYLDLLETFSLHNNNYVFNANVSKNFYEKEKMDKIVFTDSKGKEI